MVTKREFISTVKRSLRESNSDSRFTNKLIYYTILKHQRWLIYRDSERLKFIKKDDIYQKIPCLKLKEVSKVSCSNIELPIDCKIYRTEKKIPEMFEDSGGVIIDRITSIDGSFKVDLTTPQDLQRKLKNPWLRNKSNKVYAYYEDGYLYFPNNDIKAINVYGFFIDDLKSEYKNGCEDPCEDCNKSNCKRFLDGGLRIPDYLEAQLFDLVVKDLMNTYKRFPEKSHEINKNDQGPN